MSGYDAKVCFSTTSDVISELNIIASDNNMSLEQLLRCIVDDFILNTPQ